MRTTTKGAPRIRARRDYLIPVGLDRRLERCHVYGFAAVTVGLKGSMEYPEREERWCVIDACPGSRQRILVHPSALVEIGGAR